MTPDDLDGWLELRRALWGGEIAEHRAETASFFVDGTLAGLQHRVFVAETGEPATRLIGFAECSLRDDKGANAPLRLHLEGWFVSAPFRRNGIGRKLIESVIDYARSQGCVTLTSDTSGRYAALSIPAHLACGFQFDPEVTRRLGPTEDSANAVGFSRAV